MSLHRSATADRWSQLSRSERMALGKAIVTERLMSVGCTVQAPSSLIDGKLAVRTPSGRPVEVFVSTQRVGGYVLWTKRRLQALEPPVRGHRAVGRHGGSGCVPGAEHRVAQRVASLH
jgi:hypothetical protein